MSLHYKALSHYFVAEGLLKSVGKFIHCGLDCVLEWSQIIATSKGAYKRGFTPRILIYDIL